MRIALITTSFPPEGADGGLASFYSELAGALARDGHEVLVGTLTSGGDEDAQTNGIRVVRRHFDASNYRNWQDPGFAPVLAYSLPRAVELYRKLEAVVTEFQPDVIECAEHGAQGLLWAATRQFPLAVRCICPQFHLIENGFCYEATDLDLYLVRAAETYVLEQADALTTPSLSLAKIISERTGLPIERFELIANPLSKSEAATPSRDIFPDRSFPRLLFVGRIEPLKGADLLVEMLPAVASAYPNVHLAFVGSEPRPASSEKSYADRLRERLKEIGLLHKTTFAGLVRRSEVPALQRVADLCLFPSRYDSSPYACLEAMLAGSCVIASRVGGMPEYITHGESGWLVEPDAQALAEAVVHLAGDTGLRAHLARTAQAQIYSKCSPEQVASRSVSLYHQAIRQFSTSRARTIPQALEFLLTAFDEYCTGTYFADRIGRAYAEGTEQGWHQGYAAGVRAERNKYERAARSLIRGVFNHVNRLAL